MHIPIRAGALAVAGLFLCGCEGKKNPGTTMSNIAADTRTVEEAEAAANAVIRATGDCATVRTLLPEAQRKLDLARAKVATVAGMASLDALRSRVNQAAEACPEGVQ